jgi:hypothetical protein
MDIDFSWIFDGFIKIFTDILTWLWELFIFIPMLIWSSVSDAVVTQIENIPVPSWMSSSNIFDAVTPTMSFFLSGFALPEGLSIMGSALLLRFLLRRIPIIG